MKITDKTPGEPHATPANLPGEGAAAARLQSPTDAPLKTFLGLIVLWASLLLIFTANRHSESYIHLEVPGVKGFAQDQAFLQSLDPRVELLLPFDMYLQGTSPRQALTNLLGPTGFRIKPADLEELKDEPRVIRFDRLPLYKAIHGLLDKSTLGFALQGRNLMIFHQTLEIVGPSDKGYSLNWSATLDLSEERTLVVPTGSSDLWFSLRLLRDLNAQAKQWGTIQVEIWKGAELLTMSKAALDQDGKAQLTLSTAENIALWIDRKTDVPADKPTPSGNPGRYRMKFYYQTFGTKK